jgi:hypothetical protein
MYSVDKKVPGLKICIHDVSELLPPFRRFQFGRREEYGQHNTDSRHYRPHCASGWWRLVRPGTLVLIGLIGSDDKATCLSAIAGVFS